MDTRTQAFALGAVAWLALLLGGCGDEGPTRPTPAPTPYWTGATTIDGAPTPVEGCTSGPEAVGSDGSGGALAVWQANCAVWAARYAPGTGWSPPEVIGRPAQGDAYRRIGGPVLAVNSAGGAVTAWVVWPPDKTAETWDGNARHLIVRRWDRLSGWAHPERIDAPGSLPNVGGADTALAMDRAGNILTVWESASDGMGLRSAHFAAGRGWSSPSRLTGRDLGFPTVAFDTSGRALGAWGDESGVATLRWYDPGRGWGAASRFPCSDEDLVSSARSVLALDGTGRAVVLWMCNDRGEILRSIPVSHVWSAVFDGAQCRFLGNLTADGVVGVAAELGGLGVDSQGRVLGVWYAGSRQMFARFDFATGWDTPHPTPGDGGRLVVAASGRAVLVGRPWDDTLKKGHLEANVWDGSTWGPAVSDPHAISEPNLFAVSVDSCGNALVVWRDSDGQQDRIWANRLEVGCTAP